MTRMRSLVPFARSLAALLLAAGVAHADGGAPVRIRDVRVGDHDGFERLVIELDRETDIAWENGPEPGEESFYIAAAPREPSKVIVSQLPEIGTVSITEMKGGTHLAIEPRPRRVRAYTLENPPRLVIDFAPPGPGPFAPPEGARPISPAKSLGPLVLEPEPGPAPAPTPQAAPPEPSPEPEAQPRPEVQPAPEAQPAPEPTPAPQPAPTPAPEVAPPAPEPPKLEPAPVRPPTPEPEVAPPPKPERPLPPPTPAQRAPFPFRYWISLVAAAGALALLVVLGLRRRALRREAEPVALARPEPTPPGIEEIAPEEIYGSGERERALEQRLDDEVRARVALEERLAQAHEELKVLRDRVHRVERRREPTS